MAAQLSEVWQRNRTLGTFLIGGVALFLVAETAIGYLYREPLEEAKSQIAAERRELQKPLFNKANFELVEGVHKKLTGGIAAVESKAEFQVASDFQLNDTGTSPENQYFDLVTKTRERMMRRALHNNIDLPENLGLPSVSPTGKEEISRYLRGLDLVQRAVFLGIEQGISRVDEIRIEPDIKGRKKSSAPAKDSKDPSAAIDEVRVKMKILGSGKALAGFVLATQQGERPFLLEKSKISSSSRGEILVGEFDFLALRFLGREQAVEKSSEKK